MHFLEPNLRVCQRHQYQSRHPFPYQIFWVELVGRQLEEALGFVVLQTIRGCCLEADFVADIPAAGIRRKVNPRSLGKRHYNPVGMVRNWADIRIAGAQGSVADMEGMATD